MNPPKNGRNGTAVRVLLALIPVLATVVIVVAGFVVSNRVTAEKNATALEGVTAQLDRIERKLDHLTGYNVPE